MEPRPCGADILVEGDKQQTYKEVRHGQNIWESWLEAELTLRSQRGQAEGLSVGKSCGKRYLPEVVD